MAPNFDRLNFAYSVNSLMLMAQGSIKKQFSKAWSGHVALGLGNSWNMASDYYESIPSGSTARPMQTPFRNNTVQSLVYSIGAGINYTYAHGGPTVGFGYRFVDAGRSALNPTSVQSSNTKLRSGKIRSHLLTLSFSI